MRLVFAGALLAGLDPMGQAVVAQEQLKPISGPYRIEGTRYDRSAYSGRAEIRSDAVCQFTWIVGNEEFWGPCIRKGNTFVSAHRLGNDIKLGVYSILPDGRLEGVWTVPPYDASAVEVLIPLN